MRELLKVGEDGKQVLDARPQAAGVPDPTQGPLLPTADDAKPVR